LGLASRSATRLTAWRIWSSDHPSEWNKVAQAIKVLSHSGELAENTALNKSIQLSIYPTPMLKYLLSPNLPI